MPLPSLLDVVNRRVACLGSAIDNLNMIAGAADIRQTEVRGARLGGASSQRAIFPASPNGLPRFQEFGYPRLPGLADPDRRFAAILGRGFQHGVCSCGCTAAPRMGFNCTVAIALAPSPGPAAALHDRGSHFQLTYTNVESKANSAFAPVVAVNRLVSRAMGQAPDFPVANQSALIDLRGSSALPGDEPHPSLPQPNSTTLAVHPPPVDSTYCHYGCASSLLPHLSTTCAYCAPVPTHGFPLPD
jgi:hypothetical protein